MTGGQSGRAAVYGGSQASSAQKFWRRIDSRVATHSAYAGMRMQWREFEEVCKAHGLTLPPGSPAGPVVQLEGMCP